MRSFHLIVNPAAGDGLAAASGVRVAQSLRDAGADVTVRHSSDAGEARRLSAQATGQGAVVVAVGGDGTIGSVAGAVLREGGSLGIVPGGRGNDFARQVGLPNDPESVARVLLEGSTRSVDVIEVADRIVLGSVYAGVDSMASDLVDKAHWLPRSFQYPYAAVRAILTHRPATYTIVIDDAEITVDAHTVVVANSGYYGSGMHIAPAAAVDDGVLAIVLLRSMPRLRLMRALTMVYDGSHVDLDDVAVLEGREVAIRSTGSVIAYGDGERIAPLPVRARVLAGALRIIT